MKTFLISYIYKSCFEVKAKNKKEALILFEKNKRKNFYISTNSNNNSSISHIGDENMSFSSEEYKQKIKQI